MSAASCRVAKTLTREGGEGANSSLQSTVLHAGQPPEAPGSPLLIAGVGRLQTPGYSGSPALCFTSRICLYFGYHRDAPWLFPMCCSSHAPFMLHLN